MDNSGFGPYLIFEIPIPGTDIVIPVTQTVTVSWLIIGVLAIVFFLLTRRLERIPRPVQAVLETAVETVDKLVKDTMGPNCMGFAPYIGSVMIFLACANLCGLVGLRPPTADLNTTLGYAMITFALIHISGVRANGLGGHLKGFTQPVALLTPINLIGEVALPISLSFRMFGNLTGGLIIMELIYSLLGSLSSMLGSTIPFLQIAIPVPFHFYFDVFSGLIQTFIFTMLTMVNISNKME